MRQSGNETRQTMGIVLEWDQADNGNSIGMGLTFQKRLMRKVE